MRENFEEGLRAHAGIEVSVLPASMGGNASDLEAGRGSKVPVGMGDEIRAMRAEAVSTESLVGSSTEGAAEDHPPTKVAAAQPALEDDAQPNLKGGGDEHI